MLDWFKMLTCGLWCAVFGHEPDPCTEYQISRRVRVADCQWCDQDITYNHAKRIWELTDHE